MVTALTLLVNMVVTLLGVKLFVKADKNVIAYAVTNSFQ